MRTELKQIETLKKIYLNDIIECKKIIKEEREWIKNVKNKIKLLKIQKTNLISKP